MKRHTTFLALALLGMLATPAIADRYYFDDYHSSRFEQRIDRQHRRIEQGVRSGDLTRKEAKRLRKQLRHIVRLEHRYTRDGHLDRHERRKLQHKLNVASNRIYRLRHNDRYRRYFKDRYDLDNHHYGYDESAWSLLFRLEDRV